jgi:hypothetical protein
MPWLRFASAAVCFASLRSADNLQRAGERCFIRHDVGLWRCLDVVFAAITITMSVSIAVPGTVAIIA